MPAARSDTIKAADLMRIIERQQFRCAYSGRELTPEVATIDHITPIARGGSNALDNLAAVHMDVNSAKGSMTRDEFVKMCRDVVEHTNVNQSVTMTDS